MKFKWETVIDNAESNDDHWESTYRAKVPGGWIVRYECNFDYDMENNSVQYQRMTNTMIFIADTQYQWEIE